MIAIQWRTIKGATWIADVSGHLIKCPDYKREAIGNLSGSPAQAASFQKMRY